MRQIGFLIVGGCTMEELTQQLSERTGIDQATAEKVSDLLQANAGGMQDLLAGDGRGLAQLLQKSGINEGIAQKIVAFLKENSANLSKWISGSGILEKAKAMLGGALASKDHD
jgi:hypothetical protein